MQIFWNLDAVTKTPSSQVSGSWWSRVGLGLLGNGDWEVDGLQSETKLAMGTKSHLQGSVVMADRAGQSGWRALWRNDKKVSPEPDP